MEGVRDSGAAAPRPPERRISKSLRGGAYSRRALLPRRLIENARREVQINDFATYRFPVATDLGGTIPSPR